MRYPTLEDLPPPPPGRTGWPWTQESPKPPDRMLNGHPWLKVSIVTPSYNQGQFIEETIRSVLLQGYPNLDYIIIDGGSTDNSIEIIQKYEPWLTYWVSEPDRGQSHAINKGFKRATGQIFAYINSDDYYYPGILAPVAQTFVRYHKLGLVHAYEDHVNSNGAFICKRYPCYKNAKMTLYTNDTLLQLTCFWRSHCFWAIGGIDERLYYGMDYDLFLRLSFTYPSKYIPINVGAFRRHSAQKVTAESKRMILSEFKAARERFITGQGILPWKYAFMSGFFRNLYRFKEFVKRNGVFSSGYIIAKKLWAYTSKHIMLKDSRQE